MPVPNTFANATTSIPLSQLDANFATAITLGNTAIQLGNTVSTLNNMTLANVTISSGTVSVANATVTGNVTMSGGNLSFTSTGQRITGDFSNATVASRLMFKSGSTNGTTSVGALPDGTGNYGGFSAYNASDAGNASVATIAAASTEAQIVSTRTGTGTYLPMTFYTNAAERMRLDTSGNVGIGTSSPSEKLVVGSGGNLLLAGASTGDQSIRVGSGRSGNGYSYIDLQGDTTYSNGLRLIRNNSGANAASNIEHRGTGALQMLTQEAAPITFLTSATERMRIDSSGNFMVGTTSSTVASKNAKVTAYQTSPSPAITSYVNATTASNQIIFVNPNGEVGSINTDGTTTSYGTSSDYRLKYDVQPMLSGLSTIAALKPSTYKWNADNSYGEGFIAHELQAVIPQAVSGEKDAVNDDGSIKAQGVDYSKIVVHLVAAIQELKAEIDMLKATQ